MDFAETMRILFSIKPRYSFILVSLIMSSASIAESLKQKQASLDQKSHQLEVYRKKTLIMPNSPSQAYASNESHFLPTNFSWVAEASGGAAWTTNGQSQTFNLRADVLKAFIAHQTTTGLATGEIFLGINKVLSSRFSSQIGIAVNHAEDATLNGVILDDASPLYNNYSYNYKVNHTSVDLKAKLLVTNSTSFTPWISAKLGVGFNYAHAFQNYPTIFEALPIANFASHSTTSFTYGLGVGVQKAIDQSWQIGLGYEFSDWGKSQLGRAPGQNVNSGLTLNHMYTNSLLINVAYIK